MRTYILPIMAFCAINQVNADMWDDILGTVTHVVTDEVNKIVNHEINQTQNALVDVAKNIVEQ